MKQLLTIVFLGCLTLTSAQEQPKLVVGIVVDQMRYDYIYRFWNQFSDDGFKKLVNEGFSKKYSLQLCAYLHRGQGHASILLVRPHPYMELLVIIGTINRTEFRCIVLAMATLPQFVIAKTMWM